MKTWMPEVEGVIARRILVNFRVKPEVVAKLLPAPFRPLCVDGWAMAGICLIRLEGIHPAFLPVDAGFESENAAHRIAIEWNECGVTQKGVFIPRRDTDSKFNAFAGGRIFPGVHHHAHFWTAESEHRLKVEVRSDDREAFVRVAARVTGDWPKGSVFPSLNAASEFFKAGARGWSPCRCGCDLEGLELLTNSWDAKPLIVERVESSWFADETIFPAGSVHFDCGLLMRDVPHRWKSLRRIESTCRNFRRNLHGLSALLEMP